MVPSSRQLAARFALRIVAVEREAGLTAGQHLVPPLSFGCSSSNDVSLVGLAQQQCHVAFAGERLILSPVAWTDGTLLNGAAAEPDAVLRAGDRIELSTAITLSVEALDPRPAWVRAHPELAALVQDQPSDDGRWLVLCDRLLETGDPDGWRIALGRAPDSAAKARALSPLDREFRDGNLSVELRCGFVRRAVLRAVGHWSYDWPSHWTLQRMLVHPLFHYLEELEIDVASLGPDIEAETLAAMEQIASEGPLPLLRQVRFGPIPASLRWGSNLTATWGRCVAAHPRLSNEANPLF